MEFGGLIPFSFIKSGPWYRMKMHLN